MRRGLLIEKTGEVGNESTTTSSLLRSSGLYSFAAKTVSPLKVDMTTPRDWAENTYKVTKATECLKSVSNVHAIIGSLDPMGVCQSNNETLAREIIKKVTEIPKQSELTPIPCEDKSEQEKLKSAIAKFFPDSTTTELNDLEKALILDSPSELSKGKDKTKTFTLTWGSKSGDLKSIESLIQAKIPSSIASKASTAAVQTALQQIVDKETADSFEQFGKLEQSDLDKITKLYQRFEVQLKQQLARAKKGGSRSLKERSPLLSPLGRLGQNSASSRRKRANRVTSIRITANGTKAKQPWETLIKDVKGMIASPSKSKGKANLLKKKRSGLNNLAVSLSKKMYNLFDGVMPTTKVELLKLQLKQRTAKVLPSAISSYIERLTNSAENDEDLEQYVSSVIRRQIFWGNDPKSAYTLLKISADMERDLENVLYLDQILAVSKPAPKSVEKIIQEIIKNGKTKVPLRNQDDVNNLSTSLPTNPLIIKAKKVLRAQLKQDNDDDNNDDNNDDSQMNSIESSGLCFSNINAIQTAVSSSCAFV